ncbi:hypothetical protein [Priestia megaterium]|uniref:hypothetical protein n=1 Tax=Priestia megaterium TaxID=1404 RepID=UPI00077D93CB|nr:hypothetical protein [Priestia megaterium]
MIRERSLLIKGLTFLLAVFILNIPFPNSTPLSHSVFSFLGLPIYGDEETMTGIQYASNAWGIILLLGLFALYKSLNRHRLKLTILAAFIVISGPGHMVEAMQKTVLTGTCDLSFKNHSSKPVTFEVALDERSYFKEDTPFLLMMNKPRLHTVTLEPKTYQTVEITSSVKAADFPSKISMSEVNGFYVNIYQNGKKRYL